MNKEEAHKWVHEAYCRNVLKDSKTRQLTISIPSEVEMHKIVDQLEPDHPKVKIPREVGEELDDWKKSNFDENLSGYIEDVDVGLDDVEKAMSWIYHRDDTSEQKRTELYGILADAYRYGWEAEPEELFYVKGPKSWGYEHAWASIRNGHMSWDSYKEHGKDLGFQYAQAFTRAELKKYHLDNDIFTLVPVEDSHGEA